MTNPTADALRRKAQSILDWPMVETTVEDGKTILKPAKWSLSDAPKLLALADELDAAQQPEQPPPTPPPAESSLLELAASGTVDEGGEILGEWKSRYYDLIASGICGKGELGRMRAAYAAWKSADRRYRNPRTMEEFGRIINKSVETLYKWQTLPFWKEAVNKTGLAILEEYNADAHRRLVHLALTEGGSAGVAALRLFYERAGQLATSTHITAFEVTEEMLSNASEEQLEQLRSGVDPLAVFAVTRK